MLNHSDDCPEPIVVHFTGARGDAMVKCRRCRAIAVDTPDADAPRSPARRNFGVPSSGYVPRYGDTWPTHRGKRRNPPKVVR